MNGRSFKLSNTLSNWALHLSMFRTKHTSQRRFLQSLAAPRATQEKTLAAILSRNQKTAFADLYKFAEIRSEIQFRARVPIHTYEELRPYIENQIGGKYGQLNPTKPRMYLTTSGTTGNPKYIPASAATLEAYRRAQAISTCFQYQTVPGIFAGKLLALVSSSTEGVLADGVPFGSMSGVVGDSLPAALRTRSLLPTEISQITDYEDRYRAAVAIAFCTEDVTCIASANPTTLLRIGEVIARDVELLLDCAERGDPSELFSKLDDHIKAKLRPRCVPNRQRVQRLRDILKANGTLRFCDLWPGLRGVVTWTSANCALLLPRLEKQLNSDTAVIDMGYLASEYWGTITVDPARNLGGLTIEDNFYEFIEPSDWEAGSRETVLLDQLQLGKQYYIIVTTRDGLYRYFINDIVEVKNRISKTPAISFVQKGKGVTNLTGEKLYEAQIQQAVRETCQKFGVEPLFFLMLADRLNVSYTLYLESRGDYELLGFKREFNDRLGELNVEYLAKLKSGRLAETHVRKLRLGTFEEYKKFALKKGQREAQFKILHLQYADEVSFPLSEYELVWT